MLKDKISAKDALKNLSILLDIVDPEWFECKTYKIVAGNTLSYIFDNISNDPLVITCIILNMLKLHLDAGKKELPEIFV